MPKTGLAPTLASRLSSSPSGPRLGLAATRPPAGRPGLRTGLRAGDRGGGPIGAIGPYAAGDARAGRAGACPGLAKVTLRVADADHFVVHNADSSRETGFI